MEPEIELAAKIFDDIAKATKSTLGGVTREAYGEGENVAYELLRLHAHSEGLRASFDEAGNLVIASHEAKLFSVMAAECPRYLALGSHLDSVPQGGNFDGLAGVIAGLVTLLRARREGVPTLPIKVLGLRGEESAWFGKASIGTRALFGALTPADLDLKNRAGKILGDAMLECRADVRTILRQERLLDGHILGFLELHIEQGPVLVARDKPVSVVTSIDGLRRMPRVVCTGEENHAGTTPMGMRHDPVPAVAELIYRIRERVEEHGSLVFTCGQISTDARRHAPSKIAGSVSFSLEWRSSGAFALGALEEWIMMVIPEIERRHGVTITTGPVYRTEPQDLDREFGRLINLACREANARLNIMSSGAGHDAAVFAEHGVRSGMIFVRNANGSHNPHEAMDLDDFAVGCDVLYRAARKILDAPPELPVPSGDAF